MNETPRQMHTSHRLILGEQDSDGRWRCYSARCGGPIEPPDLEWMGEHEPAPFAVPMHTRCADAPWPLYPLGADPLIP